MSLYGYWMEFAQKKHFCAAHFYNKCAILEKTTYICTRFCVVKHNWNYNKFYLYGEKSIIRCSIVDGF